MIHLIIPDAHFRPDDDFTRAVALGNFIVKNKPDKIISIGDLADFDSVSHFNKPGSINFEGKRLEDDFQSLEYGLACIFQPVYEHNNTMSIRHRAQYWPAFYCTIGNHEERVQKLMDEDSRLEGLVSVTETINSIYPCTFADYGHSVDIDDILYTHIPFKNGVPIRSVVNTCGQALSLSDKSIVFGHTHRLEMKQDYRYGGNGLITALNVGCFF